VGEARLVVAGRPARPADDHEHGVRPAQLRQGADRHVGPLERLDPPDEQDDRAVDRQADRPTGAGAVARGEEGVLDGRRHDLDAARGVAVEPAELALLFRAADADGVAAFDDLGFGLIPPRRLEVAALGLDPRQRVERGDERDVELVLEAVADDAAQPVVAVHGVDPRPVPDVLGDTGSECVELRRQRLLRQVIRARRHVDDTVAGLDQDLLGEAGTIGAGERRALDPGLGEGGGDLAHVDVHPSAVARARLDQRRRVERDHRHPEHGRRNANGRRAWRPGRPTGRQGAVAASASPRRSTRRG
jgi:hypothetical protein